MNEFELEQENTRTEVAAHLRKLADGLEKGDKVTMILGDSSVTIDPPEQLHFKVETDTESSWLGSEHGQSIEIELGWDASEVDSDDERLIIVQQSNERHGRDDPTPGETPQR